MTLMELVVALTITGLLTAAGTATFSSIIDHRGRIEAANVHAERAAALRDMLRTWVTAGTIQTRIQSGPNATILSGGQRMQIRGLMQSNTAGGVTAAIATGDELHFTTNALTPVSAPSTRIRLYVDRDDATPEVGLAMEYQPAANIPLQRRQLDPTIGSMAVEWLDIRTRRWIPASEGNTVTPMAVRLSFSPIDETNPELALHPLLQVPLVFRIGDPAVPPTQTAGGSATGVSISGERITLFEGRGR